MAIYRKREKNQAPNRTLQSAIGLGYQFLAATLLFVGAGYYIDLKRGGGSAFTLIGVLLTFLYGGYEVWKLVKFLEKEDENSQSSASEPEDS